MRKYILLVCFFFSASCLAGPEFTIEMGEAKPGQLVRTEWLGTPISVLYRTKDMINNMQKSHGSKGLVKEKVFRSKKPEYFVFIDRYKDSDARLRYIKEGNAAILIDTATSVEFDATGRSDKGELLKIPEYEYSSDTKILITPKKAPQQPKTNSTDKT